VQAEQHDAGSAIAKPNRPQVKRDAAIRDNNLGRSNPCARQVPFNRPKKRQDAFAMRLRSAGDPGSAALRSRRERALTMACLDETSLPV